MIIMKGIEKFKGQMDKNILEKSKWKNKNEKYIFEIQKLFDLIDNIEDERLREDIIRQVLKYDKCITNIAEEEFKQIENKYYK